MLNKKFLFGTAFAAAMCLTACSNGDGKVTETSTETTLAAASAETAKAEETAASEETTDVSETSPEEDIQIIKSPDAAVKNYLQELSESENVKSVKLLETKISQTDAIAYKYYESPLAEEYGVTEGVHMIPVYAVYRVEYTKNSGLQSCEKSEYFIVKSDESGLEVVDAFAYDPREYRGEIKEVLTGEKYHGVHYLVELDGGLGTVICNNAAMYGEFEAGTRIYIEANGDIYGEQPRLDAIFMCEESEMSDD